MADSFKVEVKGDKEALRYLVKVLPESLFKYVQAAYKRATAQAQETVALRLKGNPLTSRTGLLARSIDTEVKGNKLATLKASIFSRASVGGVPVVYAPIQEMGGDVVAKNKFMNVPGGPYLSIPLKANKTAAGVTRMTPRVFFGRADIKSFIAKSKSGNWIIFQRGMVENIPMFVLKKKVTIPPRLGMRDAVKAEIPTLLSLFRKMDLSK
jgi:hypothetical protein